MPIVFFVLVIVNIILYHKIFRVYYFDVGKGLINEFICAVIFAILEIALFMWLGSWIVSLIVGVVSLVGTVILWIVLGVLGIGAIYFGGKAIRKFIKQRQEKSDDTKEGEYTEKREQFKKTVNEYKEKAQNVFKRQPLSSDEETKNRNEETSQKPEEVFLKPDKEGEKEEKQNHEYNLSALDSLQEEQEAEMVFCVYCGKKISSEARFCSFCGKVNNYMKGGV